MTNSYDQLLSLIRPIKEEPSLSPGTKFYIPFKGKDTEFVILGKNVNPSPGEDDNFIDVMSTSIILEKVPFIYKDNIKYRDIHYLNSDIKSILLNQEVHFPVEIQNRIIPRKAEFLCGIDLITGTETYDFIDIGRVWIPSLKEVGYQSYYDDSPSFTQYPYFKENDKGLDGMYWTRTISDIYNKYVYCICTNRQESTRPSIVDTFLGAPLCIRLKVDK